MIKNTVYLLPIRCIIFILLFVIGATITKQKVENISNWWSIAASLANIVIIFLLFLITKKNGSSYWNGWNVFGRLCLL